jgi:hypothetical protein
VGLSLDWAETIHSRSGVLSATHGRPPTLVQGRPRRSSRLLKSRLLTRPTQARLDAPFPMQRSRIVQTLHVLQRVRLRVFTRCGLAEQPAGSAGTFRDILQSWILRVHNDFSVFC